VFLKKWAKNLLIWHSRITLKYFTKLSWADFRSEWDLNPPSHFTNWAIGSVGSEVIQIHFKLESKFSFSYVNNAFFEWLPQALTIEHIIDHITDSVGMVGVLQGNLSNDERRTTQNIVYRENFDIPWQNSL
jgi:hypothetical protein